MTAPKEATGNQLERTVMRTPTGFPGTGMRAPGSTAAGQGSAPVSLAADSYYYQTLGGDF